MDRRTSHLADHAQARAHHLGVTVNLAESLAIRSVVSRRLGHLMPPSRSRARTTSSSTCRRRCNRIFGARPRICIRRAAAGAAGARSSWTCRGAAGSVTERLLRHPTGYPATSIPAARTGIHKARSATYATAQLTLRVPESYGHSRQRRATGLSETGVHDGRGPAGKMKPVVRPSRCDIWLGYQQVRERGPRPSRFLLTMARRRLRGSRTTSAMSRWNRAPCCRGACVPCRRKRRAC